MLATGGGSPPTDDANPISERVRSIVPGINLEIINEYDSIGIFQKKGKYGWNISHMCNHKQSICKGK